jgi:hypothetical protein
MIMFRCTRNVYPEGTLGHNDCTSRQGHYVLAESQADVSERFKWIYC